MAYYYVHHNGTATGDGGRYASQQSGAFPSSAGVYPDLQYVFSSTTTSPTHGDFICVSDQHSDTYAGVVQLNLPQSTGAGATIISVDDTACDQYKRGAYQSTTGGNNINVSARIMILGMDFETGNDFTLAGEEDVVIYDCTFTNAAGSADKALSIAGDVSALFINCTITNNNTGNDAFTVNRSSYLRMINCVFDTSAGYGKDFIRLVSTETSISEFIGCDFSSLSMASSALVDLSQKVSTTAYPCIVSFERCKLPTLSSIVSDAPSQRYIEVALNHSATNAAESEYQHFYINGLGQAEDETGIYRDGSAAYDSGLQLSYKVTTVASTSRASPFEYVLPSRLAKLSSTATDTIRIHLTCASALTDADVWAQVVYPDGTNAHEANMLLSVTDAFNPFRTGSALSTNTESWTGALANRYHIDVDTSADPGSDCVPIIRVFVATSATIYFCSTIETY